MPDLIFDICWDEEAQVWYTSETPIPGVLAEAPTVEELQKKLSIIISEIRSEAISQPIPPAPFVIKAIHLAQQT